MIALRTVASNPNQPSVPAPLVPASVTAVPWNMAIPENELLAPASGPNVIAAVFATVLDEFVAAAVLAAGMLTDCRVIPEPVAISEPDTFVGLPRLKLAYQLVGRVAVVVFQ